MFRRRRSDSNKLKYRIPIHNHSQICAARTLSGWRFLLLFVAVNVLSLQVYGKTPAQYRDNVKAARILVESLIYVDVEEMSAGERRNYERQALSEIRGNVPVRERIEWQAATVETNNQWLADKLNEFEKQPENSARRTAILTEISERLGAIERKTSELENTNAAAERTKNQDKQKLSEILRREEYVKPEAPEESLFDRTWKRFKQWLRDMFPQQKVPANEVKAGFATVSKALQIIIYALLLGFVGFLIYRFAPFFARKFKGRARGEKMERIILGEKIADGATPQNLLDEAENLARSGNLRGAIRKGYIALLCELDERKIIGLARHKTNRDYLRDVSQRDEIFENMNPLTVNFERHWYGGEAVAEKDWNEFKDGYKKVVSL